MDDFILIIILSITTLSHQYLEAYEEYTMKTRQALVSVVFATLFYVVVLLSWWYSHP